ncbi:MAG: hypothetical protein EOP38_20045 [Rubrivivax sp.]|nr:MAG: hypothetical protein EOP38_20045 [Rubrivivax sp.]
MKHSERLTWVRGALIACAGGAAMGLAHADSAHYFVVREQPNGTLSVASHRLVQVSGKVSALTSAQASRQQTVLAASVIDKTTGAATFSTQALGSPWLRAEFHGKDGHIDGRTLPATERQYVLRLPVAAGKMLRLRSGNLAGGASLASASAARAAPQAALDIDLDRYVTTPAAAHRSLAAPPPGDEQGILVNNGNSANRLDLLLVAEGYTLDQKAQFLTQATELANKILSISPYKDFKQLINVRWLFVPSNQSGADKPDCAETPGSDIVSVDTAFDASYCLAGIRRLLVVDGSKVLTAAAAVPDWDMVMVLVNDEEYGGSGGFISVASTNGSSAEVMQHELGHSFSKLADEYDSPYPGYGACSDLSGSTLGLCEANVTNQTARSSLKWNRWLAATTTVPTVAPLADPLATGLWEGARYQSSGMYRQCFNGIMRSLGVPFCHVDSDAFVKQLFGGNWGTPAGGISLIDPGALPLESTLTANAGTKLGFQATLAGSNTPGGMTATWLVDGKQVQTGAGLHGQVQNFSYTVADALLHKVELKVRDNTPLTLDAPTASKVWTVQGVATLPGAPTFTALTAGWYSLTLKFTPPTAVPGVTITGYLATCTSPGRATVNASAKASPITLSWLPGGVTYTCTVTAKSAFGNSPPSAPRSAKTLKLF